MRLRDDSQLRNGGRGFDIRNVRMDRALHRSVSSGRRTDLSERYQTFPLWNDASQGREHSPSLDRQDRAAGNKGPAGANIRHQIPFMGGTRCGRLRSTKQQRKIRKHKYESRTENNLAIRGQRDTGN